MKSVHNYRNISAATRNFKKASILSMWVYSTASRLCIPIHMSKIAVFRGLCVNIPAHLRSAWNTCSHCHVLSRRFGKLCTHSNYMLTTCTPSRDLMVCDHEYLSQIHVEQILVCYVLVKIVHNHLCSTIIIVSAHHLTLRTVLGQSWCIAKVILF